MEAQKKCQDCGNIKKVSAYSKNATKPDGYQNRCKLCQVKYKSEWKKTRKPEESQTANRKPELSSNPGNFQYIANGKTPKELLKEFIKHLQTGRKERERVDFAGYTDEDLKKLILGIEIEIAKLTKDPAKMETVLKHIAVMKEATDRADGCSYSGGAREVEKRTKLGLNDYEWKRLSQEEKNKILQDKT
jgi:hypothetical protein